MPPKLNKKEKTSKKKSKVVELSAPTKTITKKKNETAKPSPKKVPTPKASKKNDPIYSETPTKKKGRSKKLVPEKVVKRPVIAKPKSKGKSQEKTRSLTPEAKL